MNQNDLCDYGCGQNARYQFKNKKLCCSKSRNSCPEIKRKQSISLRKYWSNEENKIRILGDNNISKRPEVKKKISKANSGERNPLYGIKRSKETRQKHSITITGRKKPKHSERMKGSDNPNWKGGIACEPYCQIWSDEEYKESIKERDGYKCLNPTCSRLSDCLCLHHINYIKKDCGSGNLATLCISCNLIANFNREWHESWYQAILYRRYNI